MKRFEVYKFYEDLNKIKKSGTEFCFMISNNKELIKNDIEKFENAKEKNPDYGLFIKEIEDLKVKHSNKDDKGEPIKIQKVNPNGQIGIYFDIPDAENEESAFRKDVKKTQDKWKKAIDNQTRINIEFETKFLAKEYSGKLYKIKKEDLPKDMNQEEMDIIYPLIEE